MESGRDKADVQLLALARDGDRAAFATLYGFYWPRAVRMATVLCGSSRKAKDVVRVAFGQAWKGCDTYSPEQETVHSWLFGSVREIAAYSRAGDDLWGRSRYADAPLVGESELSDDGEDDDVGTDAVNAIALLLADAPQEQRETIALAFFGELSPAEIAKHLDLPQSSVEGRIRFGLEALKSQNYSMH